MQIHNHKKFCKNHKKSKKNKYPRHGKSVLGKEENGFVPQLKGMRKNYLINGLSDKNYDLDYVSLMSRFLMSRVGKKWDDVHSEICREVDHRSRDGIKTRDAIDFIVVKNCSVNDDGEIINETGAFLGDNVFYVENGILGYIAHKSRKTEEEQQKVFEIDGVLYHNHDGNWYRVKMQTIPESSNSSVIDAFTSILTQNDEKLRKVMGDNNFFKKKYGLSPDNNLWYCCDKQSANKHEIKKIKSQQL